MNDHRRIGRGLQRLKHPKLDGYGQFRSWLHSREIEGDIRMIMDLIRLDTKAHMVSLRGTGRVICTHLFDLA